MHGRRSLGRALHPVLDNINCVARIIRHFEDTTQLNQRMENQEHHEPPANQGQRMTMGEYAFPTIGNQPSPIVLDPMLRRYKLKSMHINLLPSFYGLLNEECLQFMKDIV